ncbi:MAG: C25 family cysteine peptidase [Candidatus Limimorpha sp.]
MKKIYFRKLAMALLVMMFGLQSFAQGRIELDPNPNVRSTQKAQNVTMSGFSAAFSYNSIESQQVTTERGVFSTITMGNSVAAGNIGEPQVPVTREMIAVPFGANPVVTVKNYTVKEYKLSDFGIDRIYPQQPSVRKDQKPEDIVFHYNEEAYAVRGYDERPVAEVTVMGTMRGIQIGALQINPLRYNAAANTIRVYNDIEVEVSFEDADMALTEKTLVNTYSPYFKTVYSALYNDKAILDVYDDHPDLWATPVKILVIANRMFEEAMEPWLTWKTEKGFYLDVNYTDEIGTSATQIKNFCIEKYNEGVDNGQAPTFVIIFGDDQQVPCSQIGSESQKVTDLYYYAVAGNDVFGDMFHSRFTCQTVQELNNVLEKSLMYEQYTMPDPSYLGNTLLIAGWDSNWNPKDGKPTIQYAVNYYYNAEHGFDNVYAFYEQPYNNPYASLSTGVNFANYTAHGSDTGWADPSFSVSNVNSLTNTDKYFWAMGNCCLAANWGYSGKCFGEAMICAEKKGAFAYIGSAPSSYWYEDYYFGVGATNVFYQMPTYEQTSFGVYDAVFSEGFNSISAVPFIGNVAVAYSHANGYQGSVSDRYYWESYHVFGDGSVTPYHVVPTENNVNHLPTFPIGLDTYSVSADPGSYIGITKDGEIYGVAEVGESGVVDVPLTSPVTSSGDVKIVVTHPQRQPYVTTVPAVALEGPYIAVDNYIPGAVPSGEEILLSMTFKNVGADATTGTTNVVITCADDNLTMIDGEGSFEALPQDQTVTLTDEFSFEVATGVADNTKIILNVTATCGSDVWEGKAVITVGAPIIQFVDYSWNGSFEPGQTYTMVANFENKGHYRATNAVCEISTESPYLTFENNTVEVGTIEASGVGSFIFNITVDESCPTTEQLPVTFTLSADNGVEAVGEGMLKNTNVVIFNLSDSYGDGWNGAKLTVTYSDGTTTDNFTISNGNQATFEKEIGIGVHVTVTFVGGSYNSECSFNIKYQDGTVIYQSSGTPTPGVQCEFDVVGVGGSAATYNPVVDLNGTVDYNTVTLTWEAPAEGEPIAYIVKRNGVVINDNVEETTFVDAELADDIYTYYVIAKYDGGTSIPVSVTVEVNVASVDENEVGFAIYPNPASNVINIESNATNIEYQLINNIGQVVKSGVVNGSAQIDVNAFEGVYFLKVVADGDTMVKKVVIK